MTIGAKLHQQLREATSILHDELEQAVDIDVEISSLPRYTAYLSRLWLVHSAMEARLEEFDFRALGFDYTARRRSRFLEHDLGTLGITRDALHFLTPLQAPAFGSIEEALGGVYVVEGSALGARMILPLIEARLRLTPARGASFFVGFGEEGKVVWRGCLAAINALDPSSIEALHTTRGAIETFAMFRRWLPASPVMATAEMVTQT